jgi:AcrR family transcriptional regulator
MTITTPSNATKSLSPKAERTRALLVSSARFVFNRDGLADARVSDIVKKSNVSHGTFYTYFTSKQDIFEHVIIEFFDEIRGAIDALSDGQTRTTYEAIHRENLAYMNVLKANARIVGLMLVHSISHQDAVTERHREESRYFMERAERSIRQFQDRGVAYSDIDAAYVSRALGCMLEQFCIQWVTQGWDFEIEAAARQLTNVWARSLGLEVPPEFT